MLVKCTREGLIGKTTASGYVIDRRMPFVALPSKKALYRFLRISNPRNQKVAYAVVLDVGPWETEDDAYVFGNAQPKAESGLDDWGRTTNKAGIDLGEVVWKALGMEDNSLVDWVFVDADSYAAKPDGSGLRSA